MVEGKNNVEATITELVKAFPAALALDSSQRERSENWKK